MSHQWLVKIQGVHTSSLDSRFLIPLGSPKADETVNALYGLLLTAVDIKTLEKILSALEQHLERRVELEEVVHVEWED